MRRDYRQMRKRPFAAFDFHAFGRNDCQQMTHCGTQHEFVVLEKITFALDAEYPCNICRHRGFLGDDQFFAGRFNNFRDGGFFLFCWCFRWHWRLVTKVTTDGGLKRAADNKNKLLPKQAAPSNAGKVPPKVLQRCFSGSAGKDCPAISRLALTIQAQAAMLPVHRPRGWNARRACQSRRGRNRSR